MNKLEKFVDSCLDEICDISLKEPKDLILSRSIVKRINKFSGVIATETDYFLSTIKKSVINNPDINLKEKAKAVDRFSKVATGLSITYLGLISRLIGEYNKEEGGV